MLLRVFVGIIIAACGLSVTQAAQIAENLNFSAQSWSASRQLPERVMTDTKRSLVPEQFVLSTQEPSWFGRAAPISINVGEQTRGDRQKKYQIGWPREMLADSQRIEFTSLRWELLADGSKVALAEVVAPTAASFRVQLELSVGSPSVSLRVASPSKDDVSLVDMSPGNKVWTSVVDGERGLIEIHSPTGSAPLTGYIRVHKLSHRPSLLVPAQSEGGPKALRCPPGTISDGLSCKPAISGSCNIDVACVQNPSNALLNAAKATVRIAMVNPVNDVEYYCSGTLISADTTGYYLYTAAHCIGTQQEAASLIAAYFADRPSCDSTAIPPYQSVGGGGTLVVLDQTMDVSLVRLAGTPPLGAVFAGWNAQVIPTNTTIVGIHHPSGDYKKFSQGKMIKYDIGPEFYAGVRRPQYERDSFINVQWSDGTTEGGSSGSGVFTYNPSCSGGPACYQLRGGLEGGGASCSTPTGIDRYSRMDLLYTRLAPYLQPSAVIPTTTPAQASMVEFFNPQFDFYFISSRESEKRILDGMVDGNANPLWYRTGYWFKTSPSVSSFTAPITRYYIPGVAKNAARGSHFYTVLNSDRAFITNTGKERFFSPNFGCDGVPNTFFCNEGTDSFVAPPILSNNVNTCLDSERKIYRTFRGNSNRYFDDGNHRYLTDASMYSYMVNDLGWIAEGVAFCATP